jgi:hypothetical protein
MVGKEPQEGIPPGCISAQQKAYSSGDEARDDSLKHLRNDSRLVDVHANVTKLTDQEASGSIFDKILLAGGKLCCRYDTTASKSQQDRPTLLQTIEGDVF